MTEVQRSDGRGGEVAALAGLHLSIDAHLLASLLSPEQTRTLQRCGWFHIDWPEQALALRVHTERIPTVDAFQPPATELAGARRCTRGLVTVRQEAQLTYGYLCSWDVRAAQYSQDEELAFRPSAQTPLALARLVQHTYQRGELQHLLESSATVRLRQTPSW